MPHLSPCAIPIRSSEIRNGRHVPTDNSVIIQFKPCSTGGHWRGRRQAPEHTFDFFRLESPGTLFSHVAELALSIENEHSLRPTGVELVDGIVDCIHHTRHRESQLRAASLSDLLPFQPILWLVEDDVVGLVRRHLPAIGGMSFLDVNK